MPRTKKEAGAAYIEKLLKLIPEDKRGAIKEALDPLAESAGEEVLLRDDYSRAMDAVTAKENEVKANSEKVVAYHGQLTNWYNGIAQDLAKGNEAVAELAKNKGAAPDPNAAPPAFDQSKFLSKEEATKLLGQSQQQAASEISSYAAYLAQLGNQHLADYGKPIDLYQLDQEARSKNLRLDVLYAEKTKDLREAKLAEAAKQHEKDLEKKIRDQVEEEYRKRPAAPYPLGDAPDPLGNVTLGGITGEKAAFGAQAAADEFYRMRRAQ